MDDPRWLDHQKWDEIIIRAETAGEAVRIAVQMDEKQAKNVSTVGNESLGFNSGLSDEKLYQLSPIVSESDAEGYDINGPAAVLKAEKRD